MPNAEIFGGARLHDGHAYNMAQCPPIPLSSATAGARGEIHDGSPVTVSANASLISITTDDSAAVQVNSDGIFNIATPGTISFSVPEALRGSTFTLTFTGAATSIQVVEYY